jgi:hypothetical protein
MNESIIISEEVKRHFTAYATLTALGVKVSQMELFTRRSLIFEHKN